MHPQPKSPLLAFLTWCFHDNVLVNRLSHRLGVLCCHAGKRSRCHSAMNRANLIRVDPQHPSERLGMSCIDISARLSMHDQAHGDPPEPCFRESQLVCSVGQATSLGFQVRCRECSGDAAAVKERYQDSLVQRSTCSRCERCTDSVLAKRLARTRERNRAAQARYRQKLKARNHCSCVTSDSLLFVGCHRLDACCGTSTKHDIARQLSLWWPSWPDHVQRCPPVSASHS